jgi:uncharacterized protein YecE (DUF72 family)
MPPLIRLSLGADALAKPRAFIGTSGWLYDSWREDFYGGVPQKDRLAFCARRFTAIEINATHYRLQSVQTFRRWRDETPPGFRFAVKAHRYLTHNKKLRDPLGPIRLERSRATGLGDKLAVVLWQLPHNFHRNLERLAAFARALRAWRRVRHAIEFRHPSWFDAEVAACLHTHGIAVCQSDAADWPLWGAVTTDFVYVRLHGHDITYASAYSERALHAWAAKLRRWMREGRDVHVYFDNDTYGDAPRNALRLLALLGAGKKGSPDDAQRAPKKELAVAL